MRLGAGLGCENKHRLSRKNSFREVQLNTSLLVREFLEACRERNLNQKTLKAYAVDLSQYSDYTDSELGEDTIENYILILRKKYKPGTVNRKIASLKVFFGFLTATNRLVENPLQGVSTAYKKAEAEKISIEVIYSVIEQAYADKQTATTEFKRKQAVRNIAVLELLLSAKISISEICALACGDVCICGDVVRIVCREARKRLVLPRGGAAIEALREYEEAFREDIRLSGRFFMVKNRKPFSDGAVRDIVQKYSGGVHCDKKITPNMFRRVC